MNENSAYLGEEKVGKLLAKFAVPCIFSLIISCLYNIVDQIFVGHGVGYIANAATGVVFPITVIGWGLSLFFGDGAAAFLSISLGRKQPEKIHKGVGNAILGTFVTGVLLIIVAYIWGDDLLMLLGVTQENISYAHGYGFIIYAMIPLALVQSCLAAIIRADGSPRYAMLAMVVGAVLNIIGDPVAIYGLHLGIAGAAWATVIGQFVSFLMCVIYLTRSKTFSVKLDSFIPDFRILGKVCQLGLSSFLTQICIVVTTIANNLLFVKYGAAWNAEFGSNIALGAFVVIMKLFQIVLNIAIGIAAGAQPIVGYNYGAKKYDRVKKLLRLMLLWTGGLTLLCTAVFEIFPKMFVDMFGGASAEGDYSGLYMNFAVSCLRIYLMFITLNCLQKVCAIFMQSIGMARLAAPLSFLRDLLLIVFALILPLGLGVFGVAWASPVADAVAFLITAPVMIWIWHKLTVMQREQSDDKDESSETTNA